jgi:hypothetical protein
MLRFVICCMHTISLFRMNVINIHETLAPCIKVFFTDLIDSVGVEAYIGRLEGHQTTMNEDFVAYIVAFLTIFAIPVTVSGGPGTIS